MPLQSAAGREEVGVWEVDGVREMEAGLGESDLVEETVSEVENDSLGDESV